MTDRSRVEALKYSNGTLGFSYQLAQGFFVNPRPDKLPPGSVLPMIAGADNGSKQRALATGQGLREFAGDRNHTTLTSEPAYHTRCCRHSGFLLPNTVQRKVSSLICHQRTKVTLQFSSFRRLYETQL